MSYPCLELILNGKSVITFPNLNFENCLMSEFIERFKSVSRDGKIYLLYQNGFIKKEHVKMCRSEDLKVIFHKNDYDGEIVSL